MLYVDTVNIQSVTDPNGDDVLNYVFISSNWTDDQSPTESPTGPDGKKTFITDVKSNSLISWVGAVQDIVHNRNDYVLIKNIELVSDGIGIQVKNDVNQRSQGSGDTHIDGKVLPTARKGSTTYKISFSVGRGTEIIGDYSIDPQLKMK